MVNQVEHNSHESINNVEVQSKSSQLEEDDRNEGGIDENLVELDPFYLPHPFDTLPDSFDKDMDFPLSYYENTPKELRLLEYCENYRRQYGTVCPDRTRLLLNPLNECGVEKCVCTTIQPIKLPYPELYSWDGAAKFVADFLSFVPLVPVTELPKQLLSPDTTLKLQKGTCFDYATLLCSLLLGVGYDAYVVSGYATRECCFMDETRDLCPYLDQPVKSVEPTPEPKTNRYTLKPAKTLTSKFEEYCVAKDLEEEANRAEKRRIDECIAEMNYFKPKPDPLFGLRVHAWILILSGKREVPESFFIESLNGLAHAVNHPMYLGIESVWNADNYWINMQDCSNGISHLDYDLTNSCLWEFLLPSATLRYETKETKDDDNVEVDDKSTPVIDEIHVQSTLDYELSPTVIQSNKLPIGPGLIVPPTQVEIDLGIDKNINVDSVKPVASIQDKLLLINLPPSWTRHIELSSSMYERRYPGGYKKSYYKRSTYEHFAPYNEPTGMISRLTLYKDGELTNPIEVREYFKNRADHMTCCIIDLETNWIKELFDKGKASSQLAEHYYNKMNNGVYTNRYMLFHHKDRVDGLEKREQTPQSMTEHYVGRSDRLYYREVHFGAKVKKFGPASEVKDGSDGMAPTQSFTMEIDRIVEKFRRDETKADADDDVAQRIFDIAEDQILLTYHVADGRIIPSRREFNKPPGPSNVISLLDDTHSTFQVNLHAKPKTQIEIYNMLIDLINQEYQVKQEVRKSENEVCAILDERTIEDLNVVLNIDLFDTLHNMEAKKLRMALEATAEEERGRCKEIDLDYLAPFLAQLDLNDSTMAEATETPTAPVRLDDSKMELNKEQAFILYEKCMSDFKQHMINKANIIQVRFEKEIEKLQEKQQWYRLNQINLTKDDEQDYLKYCNNATFRITTLENMLTKHKQTAPKKFVELEQRLRMDERLRQFWAEL